MSDIGLFSTGPKSYVMQEIKFSFEEPADEGSKSELRGSRTCNMGGQQAEKHQRLGWRAEKRKKTAERLEKSDFCAFSAPTCFLPSCMSFGGGFLVFGPVF